MDNRDLQIVRQSSLKAASVLCASKNVVDVKDVIAVAQLFVDWVFSEQGEPLPAEPATQAAPLPETPSGVPSGCPKCTGPVFDNRGENAKRKVEGKPNLPLFKCKDRVCGWVMWG